MTQVQNHALKIHKIHERFYQIQTFNLTEKNYRTALARGQKKGVGMYWGSKEHPCLACIS